MALNNGDDTRLGAADIAKMFGTAQSGPRPTEEQLLQQSGIAADVENVAQRINATVEDGPAKTQALIHLQAALMWAGKQIFAPAEF